MRNRLRTALLLGAFLLALPAAAPAKEPIEGNFFHHVFFWLNEPANPSARQEFLTSLRKMQAIPAIKYSYIGAPAGTQRDVVDNSWTFYWLVTFDDRAAYETYDKHPLHDEFRKKAGLWKKVLVYDTTRQP